MLPEERNVFSKNVKVTESWNEHWPRLGEPRQTRCVKAGTAKNAAGLGH